MTDELNRPFFSGRPEQSPRAAWTSRLAARRRRSAQRGQGRQTRAFKSPAPARTQPRLQYHISASFFTPSTAAELQQLRRSHRRRAAPSPANRRAISCNRRRIVLRPTYLTPSQSHWSQGEGPLAVSVAATIASASPERALAVAEASPTTSSSNSGCGSFVVVCRCTSKLVSASPWSPPA